MATKPPFHWVVPPLQPATEAQVEQALRSLIEQFVLATRRPRALALWVSRRKRARPQDLVGMLDQDLAIELSAGGARPSPSEQAAVARVGSRAGGVFIDENGGCWMTTLGTAIADLSGDGSIFIAVSGACAVVHADIGSTLLFLPR